MTEIHSFNRTLDQELVALLRGASLECLVCGEFVLIRRGAIHCPECGFGLHDRVVGEQGLEVRSQTG